MRIPRKLKKSRKAIKKAWNIKLLNYLLTAKQVELPSYNCYNDKTLNNLQ